MDDAVIQTENLRKVFGATVAVKDLTLDIYKGEVFGFLGLNGAGKTTSIKMLLGLVIPTGGRAMVLGHPLGHVETRRKIGFLPEHFRFHDWLTATEFLRIHGRLYGMSSQRLNMRIPELLELVGLISYSEQRLQNYSKGMLQRIGLAQALLNEPELIFLDEPTSGLDPGGRRLVRDIIRDQRRLGTTIFLNSHLLSEVEITCDRAAFIKNGEVLEIRDLQGLTEGEITVEMRVRNLSQNVIDGLERWSAPVGLECDRITLNLADETVLPEVVRYMVTQGVEVYSVIPKRLSLEELFIRIVGTDGGL